MRTFAIEPDGPHPSEDAYRPGYVRAIPFILRDGKWRGANATVPSGLSTLCPRAWDAIRGTRGRPVTKCVFPALEEAANILQGYDIPAITTYHRSGLSHQHFKALWWADPTDGRDAWEPDVEETLREEAEVLAAQCFGLRYKWILTNPLTGEKQVRRGYVGTEHSLTMLHRDASLAVDEMAAELVKARDADAPVLDEAPASNVEAAMAAMIQLAGLSPTDGRLRRTILQALQTRRPAYRQALDNAIAELGQVKVSLHVAGMGRVK